MKGIIFNVNQSRRQVKAGSRIIEVIADSLKYQMILFIYC